MTTKTKNSCSTQENTQQTNYNTENPSVEENTELFFYQAEEQAERDTIYSLLAEMRGV